MRCASSLSVRRGHSARNRPILKFRRRTNDVRPGLIRALPCVVRRRVPSDHGRRRLHRLAPRGRAASSGYDVRVLDSSRSAGARPDRRGRPTSPEVELSSATCAIPRRCAGARGRRRRLPLRCAGRRGPEHVRDRRVHVRQQRRDGGAARGAVERPVRAAGRRVEHEHLRRGPVPRCGGRARTARRADAGAAGAASGSSRDDRWPRADRRWRRPRGRRPRSLGLRALEVRPGADVPHDRARPTASRPSRCGSSTCTAPRQALSNPYTGVLAIFASRLLNGSAPLVFEDGQQRRDFVHVHDVARACRLALERRERGRRRAQRRQRPRVHDPRRRGADRARARPAASRRRSRASTASATSATAPRTSRSRARCSATSHGQLRRRPRASSRAG